MAGQLEEVRGGANFYAKTRNPIAGTELRRYLSIINY